MPLLPLLRWMFLMKPMALVHPKQLFLCLQKRHSVLSIEEDADEEVCCVCGEKGGVLFWLGCSYKHPKIGRQTCGYWGEQWCANLYFKNERDLNNLPYFCPKHGREMQKKAIGTAPKEKKILAKFCKQLKKKSK